MDGILYGVGVGPGNPKLMTCLAIETIEKCPVIAVPAEKKEDAVSYRIASGMVKGLEQKECIGLLMPMTKKREILEQNYVHAAEQIIECLKDGKDVAYLTLGDPTIYSTYIYIHRLVQQQGFGTEIISGVTSFCAAAAKLGDSLADRSQELHIIPSAYGVAEALDYPGNKILMKAGSKLPAVKQALAEKDMAGGMVENCGLPGESIYTNIEKMPEKASYYSVILVKEDTHDRIKKSYEKI